jgi:hypothetical protein
MSAPYKACHTEGSTVRVAAKNVLEDFAKTWKLHNPLTPKQLAYAGHETTVKSVGYYHGGDVLYVLRDLPGVWHERCIEPAP